MEQSTILYAMATEAEYGAHLRTRIRSLMTGVGPVEAAVSVTSALSEAATLGSLPSFMVSLGSAGSARLEHTKVYQASSVSYRDMNAEPLGFSRGVTPFLGLPAELALPFRIPGLPVARLSTGADIVSGNAYAAVDADMVDMESYAVYRACQAFNVPLIVLRGISDGLTPLEGIDSWTRHLDVVDRNLAKAVDLLEAFVLAHGPCD